MTLYRAERRVPTEPCQNSPSLQLGAKKMIAIGCQQDVVLIIIWVGFCAAIGKWYTITSGFTWHRGWWAWNPWIHKYWMKNFFNKYFTRCHLLERVQSWIWVWILTLWVIFDHDFPFEKTNVGHSAITGDDECTACGHGEHQQIWPLILLYDYKEGKLFAFSMLTG